MRKGLGGLAMLVQGSLWHHSHSGPLFLFWGKHGDLIKLILHVVQGPPHRVGGNGGSDLSPPNLTVPGVAGHFCILALTLAVKS